MGFSGEADEDGVDKVDVDVDGKGNDSGFATASLLRTTCFPGTRDGRCSVLPAFLPFITCRRISRCVDRSFCRPSTKMKPVMVFAVVWLSIECQGDVKEMTLLNV